VEATVAASFRVSRPSRWFRLGLLCAIGCGLAGAATEAALTAQEQSAGTGDQASPLRVESLRITPERPGSDTLCQLTLRLHNSGAKPMYAFALDVTLNGAPLPIYERQLFLQAVRAGETAELRLFNFWTTETGRARPADGRLVVEVRVREALWLDITTEPAEPSPGAADGEREMVEVWTPAGEVPGLPVRGSATLELSS
jgi:hypothetical protein